MRREIPKEIKEKGITKDESVFDITLGTCIFFFVKKKSKKDVEDNQKVIKYFDVWGPRDNTDNLDDPSTKFGWLNTTNLLDIDFINISPKDPHFLFIPYKFEYQEEYDTFIPLEKIFIKFQVGITTARDSLVVGFTKKEVENKIRLFANKEFHQLKRMGIKIKDYKSANWYYNKVSSIIDANKLDEPTIYVYRGFDKRYVYYNELVIHRMCKKIMQYMKIPNNIALLTTKQLINIPFNHIFITKNMTDIITLSTKTKENAMLFPLLLNSNEPNIKDEIINEVREKYNIKQKRLNIAKLIFNYIYAILHSSIYRDRYAKGLAKSFPCIPFGCDKENFKQFSRYGKELITLHLLISDQINTTLYEVSNGSGIIKQINYNSQEKRLFINETQYIGNISLAMWEFKVGTIPQIENWLLRRKGRLLSASDFDYFLKMLDSIRQTIEIVPKIDNLFQKEFLNN